MIRQLLRLFGRCYHEDTYLERRTLGDVDGVLHLVCRDCGKVRPALDRTLEEHARIKATGAVPPMKAKRSAHVLPMRRVR